MNPKYSQSIFLTVVSEQINFIYSASKYSKYVPFLGSV